MTYDEIIKQALTHLEYNTDEDSMAEFRDKFILYANEAVRLIAEHLRLEKVDTVQLENNRFDLSDLSKPLVTKVCEVFVDKRQYPFVTDSQLGDFVVGGVAPDATVSVRYRWMPENRTDGADEPDIPAVFHPIIWYYVVHCHVSSHVSGMKGYNYQQWYSEFERQRKIVTRSYGAYESYKFKNLPWQTGEI